MALSIIIPTHNRLENLTLLVESILSFQLAFEFEIHVINDRENKAYFSHLNVSEHFNEKGGVAASRNLGVSRSKNDFLLFIDDDMIVTEKALNWIHEYLSSHQKVALNVDWEYPLELISRARKTKFGRYLLQNNHASLKGWMNSGEWIPNKISNLKIIASCFLGMHRSDFNDVLGYDEKFPFAGFEDYDFAEKLNANHVQGILNTELKNFHNEAENIFVRNWLTRRYRAGYTNAIAAYELNYKDREINYSGTKTVLFRMIYALKECYLFSLWLIPNLTIFDKLFCSLFNPLLGAYIFKGYKDGIKKSVRT